MTAPFLLLWLAVVTPQTATPNTPTASEPSATQAAQTPSTASAKTPCSNPDATGKYHIGCGVTSPIAIHQVDPSYPDEARAKKLLPSDTVITLTVDAEGNPTNIHVKNSMVDRVSKSARSAQKLLEDAMVDAVRHYKFKPAMFEGKPVPVDLNVEITINVFSFARA
jgi:TonB family protein